MQLHLDSGCVYLIAEVVSVCVSVCVCVYVSVCVLNTEAMCQSDDQAHKQWAHPLGIQTLKC